MVEILTGGGLGDASIAIGKILNRYPDKNVSVVHARDRMSVLSDTIRELYETQGIEVSVEKGNVNEMKPYFDKVITPDWQEWKNPFPKFKVNKRNDIDMVFSPFAGEGRTKELDPKEVKIFLRKYKPTIIGKTSKPHNFNNSLINKTTLAETLDIIASSNVVVAPEGFVVWFACMCGKKVFTQGTRMAIERRAHPDWDLTKVKNLSKI